MERYTTEGLMRLLDIDPSRIVGIDLETTGLDPAKDEILEVGIVDGNGEVLFDHRVRPHAVLSWPYAERLTGISRADVAGEPSIGDFRGCIEDVLSRAELLVGYNLAFDMRFLRAADVAVPNAPCYDVMREFAAVAQRRDRRGRLCWQKLGACARHYGVTFEPHGAVSDIRATMECFRKMLHDDGSRYTAPGTVPYLRVVHRRCTR